MHEVTERIEELALFLQGQAAEAERLGRLPDETVRRLKQAGAIRIMQPREYGGYEAHPADWFEMAARAGSYCGSTGWICGITGVHPWHMALCHPKVQAEVWGKDPDTWIASPYSPAGKAAPADDGYMLSGRWSFSSGTDHCDWIFLGGVLVDAEGQPTSTPPKSLHFILPRSDYEIVEDSWDVMGLKGTGSKDIIVRRAYVPKYRTIDTFFMRENGHRGGYGGRPQPLYNMPFSPMFGAAISAAILGACEGLMAEMVNYQRDRVNRMGQRWAEDPLLTFTLGEAAADIHAGGLQIKDDLSRMYDVTARGEDVPYAMRVQARRNQVRAVQRAVDAADKLFTRSGGNALRADKALPRLWRDAHAGLNHMINVPLPIYQAYAATTFGYAPPVGVLV